MRGGYSISGKIMVEKSAVEESEIWGEKLFQDGVNKRGGLISAGTRGA